MISSIMVLLSLSLLCIAVMTLYCRLTHFGRRKRLICVATSCCSLVSGLLLLNQAMPITTTSCTASDTSNNKNCIHGNTVYQILRKNELSLVVDHPSISSVHINFLGSNSPNEDRYSLAGLPNDCVSLFAVIDGHKSQDCSEHLKHTLLPYVYQSLVKGGVVKGPLNVHKEGDQLLEAGSSGSCEGNHDNVPLLLREGFNELDKNISQEGLKIVELIKSGRSIREEGMLGTLMKALAGACALVAMVTRNALYVANTGDCRSVMGTWMGKGFEATPLSKDQNVHNTEEVERVKGSHPKDEESTVIVFGRLLGNLMPFRSFGDNDLKWSKDTLDYIMNPVAPNYSTPPYLTAEPIVTTHTPIKGQFMILATDGLWDKLTNQEAVDTVGQSLGYNTGSSPSTSSIFNIFKRTSSSCCTDRNSATELLWKALGGDEQSVDSSLKLDPKIRRMYRDDITIIVVHFK